MHALCGCFALYIVGAVARAYLILEISHRARRRRFRFAPSPEDHDARARALPVAERDLKGAHAVAILL
eukprot:1495002-Pleurochrysis_carterae.AAC.1